MSETMTRFNKGKLPISLVPSSLIRGVAEILAFGAKKYAPNNWRKGGSWTEVYESCQRHLLDWNEGQDLDKESQLQHLKHAACNLAFLIEFVEKGIGQDDRFRYPVEPAANDDKPTKITGTIRADQIVADQIVVDGKAYSLNFDGLKDLSQLKAQLKAQLPPWGIPLHTGGEVKGRAQPVWEDGSPMRVPMPEVRS